MKIHISKRDHINNARDDRASINFIYQVRWHVKSVPGTYSSITFQQITDVPSYPWSTPFQPFKAERASMERGKVPLLSLVYFNDHFSLRMPLGKIIQSNLRLFEGKHFIDHRTDLFRLDHFGDLGQLVPVGSHEEK